MATQPNTNEATTPAATEAAKPKTVIDDMASRRIFDSTDDAATYIAKCQADFPDFDGYPVAAAGFTEDGDFDPEVYTEEMRVAVAVLTQRGEGPNSSTVKAIVIYPTPKIDAILSSDAGQAWLTSIMEKELNHVAVRNLRKAGTPGNEELTIADAIESMPTSISDYITSNREATGGILEVYNTLWQLIKKALGKKFKAFALANLSKKELRKGIESASYASAIYPQLEDRTNKAGEKASFFEIAGNFGILLAKEQGLDPAFFEKALANRNEKTIEVSDDEDDFDMEAMAAELSKPKADDSTDGKAATTPEGEATGEQTPTTEPTE